MMRGPSQGTPSAPKTNPLRAATRQPVGLANPQAFLCYANAFLQATVPMAKAWGPSIAKHELYKTWVAMCAYTGPVLGAKFATDLRDMIPAFEHSLEHQDVQEFKLGLFRTFDPAATLCHEHTYVTSITCTVCGNVKNRSESVQDVTIVNTTPSTQEALFGIRDPETLDEDADCDMCEQKRQSTIAETLETGDGTFLWILIKVFDKAGNKLASDVEISDVITNGRDIFQLLSVVAHIGVNLKKGHYVTHRRLPSGDFIRCDDRDVAPAGPTFVPWANETPYLVIYKRDKTDTSDPLIGGTQQRLMSQITPQPQPSSVHTPAKATRRDEVHVLLESYPELLQHLQAVEPDLCKLDKETRDWLTTTDPLKVMEALSVSAVNTVKVKFQLSRLRAALCETLDKAPPTPTPVTNNHQQTSRAPAPQAATRRSGPRLFSTRMVEDPTLHAPSDDKIACRGAVEACRPEPGDTISYLVAERIIAPRMLPAGQPANRGTVLSEEVRADPNVYHWITVLLGRIEQIPGAPAYVLAALHLLGTSVNQKMVRIIAQGEVDAARSRRGVPEYVTHAELQQILLDIGHSEMLTNSERAALMGKPKKAKPI